MQKFAEIYGPDELRGESRDKYRGAFSGFESSAVELLARFAGTTFGGGVYRLYGADEIGSWTAAVGEPFEDYRHSVRCFGRDWLCNQFCLDSRRKNARHEPLVLMFEISTGQVLEIPETLESFHSKAIVNDPHGTLLADTFRQWRLIDPQPLSSTECVGYKLPLFLNGKDELENLERIDAEVYWHITSQVLIKTRDLPEGTAVEGFPSRQTLSR